MAIPGRKYHGIGVDVWKSDDDLPDLFDGGVDQDLGAHFALWDFAAARLEGYQQWKDQKAASHAFFDSARIAIALHGDRPSQQQAQPDKGQQDGGGHEHADRALHADREQSARDQEQNDDPSAREVSIGLKLFSAPQRNQWVVFGLKAKGGRPRRARPWTANAAWKTPWLLEAGLSHPAT